MNTWQDISKLPSECEDVLVYSQNKWGVYTREVAYLLRGEFRSSVNCDLVCPEGFVVTHWMPLPEGPAECTSGLN